MQIPREDCLKWLYFRFLKKAADLHLPKIGAVLSSDVVDLSIVGPGIGPPSCYEGQGWWSGGPPPLLPTPWTPPASQPNHTFWIRYRLLESSIVLETSVTYYMIQECEVRLEAWSGNLSSRELLGALSGMRGPCTLELPGPGDTGLLLEVQRLNVPCSGGRLALGGRILCGKLEEIAPGDRRVYFPPEERPVRLRVEGSPVFDLEYRTVDYCFNVTLTERNMSFEVRPRASLECHFLVLLPYGYRVSLDLRLGGGEAAVDTPQGRGPCSGLLATLHDGPASWDHCALPGQPVRELHVISTGNRISLQVTATPHLDSYPTLSVKYEASGVAEVTGGCGYPWVSSGVMCYRVVEGQSLGWEEAELHCGRLGGHLASIRSQAAQTLVDTMLTNSPGYRDENAYWVGGTDRGLEGDFRWSDSLPFTYTNWFPGWGGQVNRQPNDDGLSEQDCLELRRLYHLPPGNTLTDSFMWNDRDCTAANHFLCERLQTGERMQERGLECNRTVSLGLETPRATVASPGFPGHYPDDALCQIHVLAPPAFRLVVDFEELVLENEPTCSYDALEIQEGNNVTRRFCGDWSERLKLLRYVSTKPRLMLRFISDYSHHFGGFKARLSIEHATPECGDDRLQAYNHSCYLFVSYPEVTWHTAREICKGMKADLASVLSTNEEKFVVSKIRESHEYSTSAIYWLGAKAPSHDQWAWSDSSPMSYEGWVTGGAQEAAGGGEEDGGLEEASCLALQWLSSPTPMLPSGLYWQRQTCDMVGGYVCKKLNQEAVGEMNLNRTHRGSEGRLSSPLYPLSYPPNLDYWVRVEGPRGTRLVFRFSRLDLEAQPDCLYDYLELVEDKPTRLCGHHSPHELHKLRLISGRNLGLLHFRSDYSVTGGGFSLGWRAVDVSGCPLTTLTASQGTLHSPNYPDFLLPHLDCSTTILAPEGRRVWLEVKEVDAGVEEAVMEIGIGGGGGRLQPLTRPHLLSDGVYVSSGERMQVTLRTGDKPQGRGFSALYRTVGDDEEEERVLELSNSTSGQYLHLNYPLDPPLSLDFTDRLVAPVGHTLHLQFHNAELATSETNGSWTGYSLVEVKDGYGDTNGTVWRLVEAANPRLPPIVIESFFNTIAIRQLYQPGGGVFLNATIAVRPDEYYKIKLLHGSSESSVESCYPNPCQNGGKCVNHANRKFCQCIGHYTGMFCGLTLCELEPCTFGVCLLVGGGGYRCQCQPGYHGETCNQKRNPCSSNPCESRGDCLETVDSSYKCRCHAWWEGARCERRMLHIPYKPLSERMLQEPFWLGLITVTVVLAVLGLFWCAKRHFPEKLEKLLAEDDRNRPYASCGRECGSVRGGGGEPPCQPSRSTLLARLGIRKPSLVGGQPTARTFSLDDLLKPTPTTPSPRKKRNNSTPTKKSSAVEKKQILQQLVAPAAAAALPKEVLGGGEATALSTNKLTVEVPSANHAETSFSAAASAAAAAAARALDEKAQQQKLEKKVTFARLLDKVSFEMAEGSGGGGGSGGGEDVKSPNSTSSNQGSDSQSSSDLHLNTTPGDWGSRRTRKAGKEESVEDMFRSFSAYLPIGEAGARRSAKTASADSILAMFRSFSGVTCGAASPSTTPTGSTPRDDVAGSDDSSTASSGMGDSPPLFAKNTIQVPVLDSLSAQRSNMVSGNNFLQPPTILLEVPNKCLSPIREMPTPVPSPALTPVMPRHSNLPHFTSTAPKMELKVPKIEVEGGPSLVIPVLRVEEASPTRSPGPGLPGSPPPHKPKRSPLLKDLDKPTSLDLPCPPPVITVTCSMSEMESDTDSPAAKSSLAMASMGGMTYLSPFSVCSRGDRTTSESNLSSSGYSSMASPGPSRCGSNNPLCPTDLEDGPHPGGGGGPPPPSHLRRPSPLLRAPPGADPQLCRRTRRSDSETMSDDPHLESNDEGFGTDQLEEKIEEGEVKSAKELEMFMGSPHSSAGGGGGGSGGGNVKHCSSFDTGLEAYKKKTRVKHCSSVEAGLDKMAPPPVRHCGSAEDSLNGTRLCKVLLQLPSIVVDGEMGEGSAVSSRSESPLSDRAGLARFSPMFYGRLTDSDGLYDCSGPAEPPLKSRRRRGERRRSRSPSLLEVPGKELTGSRVLGTPRAKPSPKRRVRPQQPLASSSSSSAESLNSIREMTLCLGSDKITDRLQGGDGHWTESAKQRKSAETTDESPEDPTIKMLPSDNSFDPSTKTQRKISRLRTVGHQIRFLRRLERSLKESRERAGSPERPLLEEARASKRATWLRSRGAASDSLLVPEDGSSWPRVVLSTSGHTD